MKKLIIWIIVLLAIYGITSARSGTNTPAQIIQSTATTTSTSTGESSTASTPTSSSPANNYTTSDNNLSNNNTYINVDSNTVHSPAKSTNNSIPSDATAQCADGTYSFSQHHSGTCSHHGGVVSWL